MTIIQATVIDGRIEVDQPLNLPNGTVLQISVPNSEDDDEMTPQEIQRVLAIMDQLEPLQMSEEEINTCEADRQARREWEKSQFEAYNRKIGRLFE